MPGRRCSVLNCTSNSLTSKRDGIQKSFFKFPKDESLRKKWALACHKQTLNFATALVCADHFREEDYTYHTSGALRPRRLKTDVVPSVNLGTGVMPPTKFANESSNKENSNLQKRKSVEENCDTLKKKPKKQSSNNANPKESVKRKSSELFFVKENAKEPAKKKFILKKTTEENSNDVSKRKISTGSAYNKNPKLKINKGENVEKCKERSKKHVTAINEKGQLKKKNQNVDLKESSNLELGIKSTANDSEESKYIDGGSGTETNYTIQIKKASSYQNSKLVTTQKNLKTRKKENSKQAVKMKTSIRNYDGQSTKKIALECTDHGVAGNSEQSQRIAIVRHIEEKTTKRKETAKNGISKKNYKKRIRLGKDDSDDEEPPYGYGSKVPIIDNTVNKLTRDKVTYNSPSEMAHNADLLKYLSYLKVKSRDSDQPILFLADK